jgi:hypothetical protein
LVPSVLAIAPDGAKLALVARPLGLPC